MDVLRNLFRRLLSNEDLLFLTLTLFYHFGALFKGNRFLRGNLAAILIKMHLFMEIVVLYLNQLCLQIRLILVRSRQVEVRAQISVLELLYHADQVLLRAHNSR